MNTRAAAVPPYQADPGRQFVDAKYQAIPDSRSGIPSWRPQQYRRAEGTAGSISGGNACDMAAGLTSRGDVETGLAKAALLRIPVQAL